MARKRRLPMEPQNDIERRCHAVLDKVFGIHHIWQEWQSREGWGDGIRIRLSHSFSSYDFFDLTRLVFAAHEFAVRVEIGPHTFNQIQLVMHPRQRSGAMWERHPTIDQALANYERLCPHGTVPSNCGRGCDTAVEEKP